MKETQFWGYGSVEANCGLAPPVALGNADAAALTRELAIFGNLFLEIPIL